LIPARIRESRVINEPFEGLIVVNPGLTTEAHLLVVFFEDTPPSPTSIGPAFAPGSFFACRAAQARGRLHASADFRIGPALDSDPG
jgi:hypothetical protein